MRLRVLLPLLICAWASPAPASELIGIRTEGGEVYRVSRTDAAVQYVGTTGLISVGGLEMGPDGYLYTFAGYGGELYRIDPATLTPTLIGPMGLTFVSEGGIAFSPSGECFVAYEGGNQNPQLFRVNLTTGAATVIGVISGGAHDINGLSWRSDGMLLALDRITNSLLTIDPVTAASSVVAPLSPAVGAAGGMTVEDGIGYFNTGTPYSGYPGSNELWSFDPFTGEHQLIGSLSPTITSPGLVGLAVIPEPATLLQASVGLALLVRRHGRTQINRR